MRFHHRLAEVLARTTCGCRACAMGTSLTLKLIAHHGTYVQQRIGTTLEPELRAVDDPGVEPIERGDRPEA